MKLTPEQIADNAAAMIAFADGKPIEIKYEGEDWRLFLGVTWASFCDWLKDGDTQFRPAPLPEPPKPWDCADDVPGPVCWLRHANSQSALLIVRVCQTGVNSGQTGDLDWNDFATKTYLYSTDRKTWKPCVKEAK